MARAAVKAKQAQRAKVQPAKARPRRGRGRGHSGGGNPNQQLFFMRLRRQAKVMYVILAVLFAVTFAFLGVGSGSSGLDQLFSNINLFHHSGTSVSRAQAEVRKNPKSAKAYRDLATAFEAKGQTSSAIGALQQLTTLQPKNVSAWSELGGLQLSLANDYATQYQQAAAAQQAATPSFLPGGTIGKAIGTDPIVQGANQQASSVASTLYQQATSQYATAVSSYQQVAKLQPESANAQFQLAQAAQSAGNAAVAVAAYKKYLQLNPSSSSASQIRQLIKQLSPQPTPKATGTAKSGSKVKSKSGK